MSSKYFTYEYRTVESSVKVKTLRRGTKQDTLPDRCHVLELLKVAAQNVAEGVKYSRQLRERMGYYETRTQTKRSHN